MGAILPRGGGDADAVSHDAFIPRSTVARDVAASFRDGGRCSFRSPQWGRGTKSERQRSVRAEAGRPAHMGPPRRPAFRRRLRRGTAGSGQPTIPAPTVSFVASSMRMNAPVARLTRYG